MELCRRGADLHLVVVGLEVGGRFGVEAVQLLRLLARHRAAAVPAQLRPSATVLDLALVWAPGCRFPARLRRLPPRAATCSRARRRPFQSCMRSLSTPGATGSRPPVARRRLTLDSSRPRKKARKHANRVTASAGSMRTGIMITTFEGGTLGQPTPHREPQGHHAYHISE